MAEVEGVKNVAELAKDEALRAKEEAMFAKSKAECSKEKVEEEAYDLGVAETQATLKEARVNPFGPEALSPFM